MTERPYTRVLQDIRLKCKCGYEVMYLEGKYLFKPRPFICPKCSKDMKIVNSHEINDQNPICSVITPLNPAGATHQPDNTLVWSDPNAKREWMKHNKKLAFKYYLQFGHLSDEDFCDAKTSKWEDQDNKWVLVWEEHR